MIQNKKLKRCFNLFIQSSKASFEDPFIGPNLSPYMARDKIKLFCEEVNNKTTIIKSGIKLLIKLYLFEDKSYFFLIKGVPFSLLLKLFLNISFNKFTNTLKVLTIYEVYDLIYFKNIFILKFINFDNFLLKKLIFNNIFSIKNLIIKKNLD